MVGCHHRLDGQEFEQTPGACVGQSWSAAVHGITKSQTRLSDQTEIKAIIIDHQNF